MEIREPSNSKDAKHYTTERLREEFLIEDLFVDGEIKRVYSHIDRIIVMGIVPTKKAIELGQNLDIMHNLGTDYFLERRELGVINMGQKGSITVDGKKYEMNPRDGLYIGRGAKEVIFESSDPGKPARFYSLSAPAHKEFNTVHIDIGKANKVPMGSNENSNKRVINQYIQPGVVESCQLCMGLTQMAPGNVWNTMPCHTHVRRMEVYAYFDLPEDARVFHYIGEPDETRHIIVKNGQAVISPSWSIHSGCGTGAYSFIWGMVGENQTFTDMDAIDLKDMK
ncbi:MAG: 5-dehydro-4-deoxy-D-glucuronate isomerase [Actinobacteria bacterium]|nr:5-dehydro-4-deoxy-D-glucuronate isomerase [Actinomycetota bacterium]